MSELIRRVVELDPEKFSWAQWRTPALHITEVIRDILLATGQVKERDGWTVEQSRRAWLQGFLWEDLFTERLQYLLKQDPTRYGISGAEYVRIGEIAVHYRERHAFWVDPEVCKMRMQAGKPAVPLGYVVVSPDGLRCLEQVRLLEMKWTLLSSKTDPEIARPDFFIQAPCYLYALNLALQIPVNDVEWHVQHPKGDYGGGGPLYAVWEKHFTDQEINDAWMMCSTHITDRIAQDRQHGWAKHILGEAT